MHELIVECVFPENLHKTHINDIIYLIWRVYVTLLSDYEPLTMEICNLKVLMLYGIWIEMCTYFL